jgi:hypothetical protein
MGHHSLAALKLPFPNSQCGRAKYRRGNALLSGKPQRAGAETFSFLGATAGRVTFVSYAGAGSLTRTGATITASAGLIA